MPIPYPYNRRHDIYTHVIGYRLATQFGAARDVGYSIEDAFLWAMGY